MADRIPEDRMPGLLRQPHPEVPLGWYRHHKSGKTYVVVGGVFRATGEDQIVEVHYINPTHGYSAHRTVADFLAPMRLPGEMADGPRFRLIQPSSFCQVLVFLLGVLLMNLQDQGLGLFAPGSSQEE
jgi:hypothetical protein